MVYYTVKNVEARENFMLYVMFTDGVSMFYDVRPLLKKWPAFNELRTVEGLFQQVKVIADGYAVSWNDRIDLACNELREHGVPVKTLKEYMELSYRMEFYEDKEEGGFTVAFPDLPGCLTCGETLTEAYEMAQDAKTTWLESMMERGMLIKEPEDLDGNTQEITLRVSADLYKKIAKQARKENYSVDQYCADIIAKNVVNVAGGTKK